VSGGATRRGPGRSRPRLAIAALAAAIALAPARSQAQPEIGSKVEQAERPTLQGPQAFLLGKDERANVLLFFRPDQEHSQATLKMMADCEQELAGRSIHWAAIVSGQASKEAATALVVKTGLRSPVLIDEGDTIYAALQVILHPVVVLVDREHKLFAYEPFRKVNYCAELRAQLQRLLGDIDQAALDRTLNPETSEIGGEKSKAGRDVMMARRRLEMESWDKAIESARRALAHDPESAAAHVVIGQALAGKSDCAGAALEFGEALRLEPKNEEAARGSPKCAPK
jgi:tetratricopeptide (TPR) repeat protein